jgi:hypothetical protein
MAKAKNRLTESGGCILALALIGVLGLACASSPQKPDDAAEEPPVTACAEPRPQACTQEYIPVCGHLYDGEPKTYANACTACADPDVSGRQPGPCEEPAPDQSEPPDDGQR